ncbi:MAG: S8 family serine peptidase, partial [Anaerolineae bacterium]|nr:S8 family serine peptidase [Anaerolineae bacterium]
MSDKNSAANDGKSSRFNHISTYQVARKGQGYRSLILLVSVMLIVGLVLLMTFSQPKPEAISSPIPATEMASIESTEAGAVSLLPTQQPTPIVSDAVSLDPVLQNAPLPEDEATPTPGPTPTPIPTYEPIVEPEANPPVLDPVPAQVVIKLQPGTSPEDLQTFLDEIGATVVEEIEQLDTIVIEVPEEVAAEPLPESPVVEGSEPDYFVVALGDGVPSDPLYPEQWGLEVIGATDAWAELPDDAPEVIVAVIDSGICADHPDLEGRIEDGWDFVEDDAVPQDEAGHGCAVSGVIAANIDNEIGIAGVAPNAQIMPLRVLDASGVGTYSDVAAAIVYAVDNGAEVINLSLGGPNSSNTLAEAINYAVEQDVLVVAAAGNTGSETILYPAAYEPVIAVGSVDPNLAASSFSATGDGIDVLAPGRDIMTTTADGDYGLLSGTSLAAPYVAGIATLNFIDVKPLLLNGSIVHYGDSSSDFTPPPDIEDDPPEEPDIPPDSFEGYQVFDYMGFGVDIPSGWYVNVYRNMGFGFSFYTPDISMEGPDEVISGAYIAVTILDRSLPIPQVAYVENESLIIDGQSAERYDYVNSLKTVNTTVDVYKEQEIYRFTLQYPDGEQSINEPILTAFLDSLQFVERSGEQPELDVSPYIQNLSFSSLSFPFDSNQGEWRILSGYHNQDYHEGYALYAFDFGRADGVTSNIPIIAPTDGLLEHPQSGYDDPGTHHCIDVSIDSVGDSENLWMEICHLDFEDYQQEGSIITKGEILGILATDNCAGSCTTPHVHLAVFIGVENNPWLSPNTRVPIPFVSEYNLAFQGISFPPNGSVNQYAYTYGLYGDQGGMCVASLDAISSQDYCGSTDPTPDDDLIKPYGSFTNPSNGATISDRTVTISVEAGDNAGGSGVKIVRFSAKWDGQWYGIGSDSSYPYSITWDMCNSNVSDGDIELGMEVEDNAGNVFIWSQDGGANPHITKNYVCTGSGDPEPGGSWNTSAWMNRYLAGYSNWEGTFTWDNGNYPYINLDWGSGAPFDGWGSDEFSFRFERDVYFPGGDYHFEAHSDDGVRVYVDNNIVLDNWWDGENRPALTRNLSQGYHQVKVEYYENQGDAYLSVWWYGPGYPRPDSDPPDGRITSPEHLSATNSSPLNITVDAWDDASGVNRVEFFAHYCLSTCEWHSIGTDYSAPYSFSWNWSALQDDRVYLTTHIYDNTGKVRMDPGGYVEVYLDRGKPTVNIDSPTENEIVETTSIPIEVTANDSLSGVSGVRFFAGYVEATGASAQEEVDPPPPAVPSAQGEESPEVTSQDYWHEIGWDDDGSNGWSIIWDASSLPDQTEIGFFVYAYDKAGNYEGDVVGGIIVGGVFTSCADVNEIPTAECEALVALYNDTDGDNWKDNTNWLQTTTPCSWYGVTCDAGHVTAIALYYNQLSGPIPPELEDLSNLESLKLDRNQLTGPIPPELGNLANLSLLHLYANQLTGSIPPELGNLSNLVQLNLERSGLTGEIPSELSNLTNLERLILWQNELTGPIPIELAGLTNLTTLDLGDNKLNGPIPSELGNLTNLEWLHLGYNQLNGPIPPELGSLPNLEGLALSGNKLSGDIPAELLNLTQLWFGKFSYNMLTTWNPGLPIWLNEVDPEWIETQTVPPENVHVEAVGAHSIELSWMPILYTDHGGEYEIGVAATSGGPYSVVGHTSDKTASTYTISGLAPITDYFIAVRTYTPAHVWQQNDLTSSWSDEVSVTTGVPAPTDLQVDDVASTSIDLSWTPVTYTEGAGYYQISYGIPVTAGAEITEYTIHGQTADSNASSYKVDGLTPGTLYALVVRTFMPDYGSPPTDIWSAWSDEVRATTNGAAEPLTEGYYEQDDPNISYSGTWHEQTNSKYSGGSTFFSGDPNAGVSFSIEGNTLTLIRTTGPTYGTQEVCIDTACHTLDNSSTSWLWRQAATFGDLGNGVHEVTISHIAGTSDLDALQVDNTSVLGEGLHEETSSDLVFTGNWAEQSHAQYSGGTQLVTWDDAAGVWFRFEGDTLSLLRTTGPSYGLLEVCIDGACQNVDDSSAEWLKRQPVTFFDLGSGVHEVRLRSVSGSHSLDALMVDNTGVLGEGLHEQTSGDLVFFGSWVEQSHAQYSGGTQLITW